MTFSLHFHKLPLQCVVRASATETNFETFILVSDFLKLFQLDYFFRPDICQNWGYLQIYV